jgi:hypothetical protein
LAAIAIPNFVQARNTSRGAICVNNLRQIDSAKEQYALEQDLDDGDSVDTDADGAFTELDPYVRGGFAGLNCPSAGNYVPNLVGVLPTCDSGLLNHAL